MAFVFPSYLIGSFLIETPIFPLALIKAKNDKSLDARNI